MTVVHSYLFAQSPDKKSDKFISVEVNDLLKQIINLGSNVPTNNPYIISYTQIFLKNEWGYHAAIGYDESNEKHVNKDFSNAYTLNLKCGVDKRYFVGNAFSILLGADLVGMNARSYTKSTSVTIFSGSSSDSILSLSTETNRSLGFGPRVQISCTLYKNFSIGTEMAYYAMKNISKNNVYTERVFTDSSNNKTRDTDNFNSDDSAFGMQYMKPISIYLTLRF